MPASSNRKLVLVVDDDETLRRVLQLLLETCASGPYAVEFAKDGREALEKIEDKHPALVILDLMMPQMDGWQVLERIRGMQGRPPVIVLSGQLDRRRAQAAGAAATLTKPVGMDVLLVTCERLLAGT